MNEQSYQKLDFGKVKEAIGGYVMSYLGQKHVDALQPLFEMNVIRRLQDELEEAKAIIRQGSSVPLPALEGMEAAMSLLGTGYVYSEEELALFARLLHSVSQLKRFMARKESVAPQVSALALSMYELEDVQEELARCVRHGAITDEASKELGKIRKKLAVCEERIRKKLDTLMTKYRSYLMEPVVSSRSGRFVLPVKKEYRKLVGGTVLDESSSGQTVFMEPADIAGLQTELGEWRRGEAREESIVLAKLTALLEQAPHELNINLEAIGCYDFLFAKARYALSIGANRAELNDAGLLRITQGRHPLLGSGCVPLDFAIGGTGEDSYRALVITGPNTGGKTVSLKCVGLLAMMVQAGLHVPAETGSTFPVYRQVLADIGDGQSIEQSLSTFSSHIRSVIGILQTAGPATLVLLDELAAGTDPGEGVALSIAVLEELYRKGATLVATTHFNEIKRFAAAAKGFENARMEFDTETLQPLYRLRIGEAGSSYAFYIAQKLGLPAAVIARSQHIAAQSGGSGASGGAIEPAADLNREEAQPSAAVKSKKPGGAEKAVHAKHFDIGDCVWIHSLKRTGIVCGPPDERGNVKVQVQKERIKVNVKRLSLYIERKQLYPGDDYDMDIVFDTKENRKKRKQMNRKYVPGLIIETRQEDQE